MNYTISSEPGARMRIDKWLWAARFFKTRSLAADALEKGRVRIGGVRVKPAKDVRVGDRVEIDIERITWQVQVLGICEVRGPASVAQTLYAETPDSQAKRAADLERRKTFREPAAELQGRPTKRDRRVIDKLADRN
jgi:ribosome-associated heat shock protein Hsp15